MEMEEIARWSFIAFVVIAIVMGLAVGYMAWDGQDVSTTDGYVLLIMLILGIIVGITSITTKEITPFLIATIALVVASSANVWSPLQHVHWLLYWWAKHILAYIVAFAAPAAVIIAIQQVFAMAKAK
ncbi:MAG: hypothetical protein PVF15_10695 [Candidatus Bathyarchaeota archaeon]|jgi:hypothetical protein